MDFGLFAVKVDNWNADLSPWQAPAVFGNEAFGDGAAHTLDVIYSYAWIKNGNITSADIPLQDFCPVGIVSDRSVCRNRCSFSIHVVPGISSLYERT